MTRIAVAAAACAALFASGLLAKGAGKKKMPELTNQSELKWTPLMSGPLPAIAPIKGDPMKGAFYAYLKLPAGFESPAHSHSSDYWGVLITGKMTHWAPKDGQTEKDGKQLAPGDLTHMPGGLVHVSKCYPGEDCLIALVQNAKFDFIPADKPAEAKSDK